MSDAAEPKRLLAASPTRIAALQECSLRVYFSRTGHGRSASTPWARLGDVCHKVFEAAAVGDLGDGGSDFDQLFEARWTQCAIEQEQQAAKQPLEAFWGPIETWPTYALKRSRVRLRARELVREMRDWSEPELRIEEELRPAGERLYGTPDLIVRRPLPYRVIDYKTGSVTDDSGALKAGYRQQLLIYAYLESKMPDGDEPELAVVVPLKGDRVEIVVEWPEVEKIVREAHRLIDVYNEQILEPLQLAAPSLDPCVHCQFATRCPAFWDRLDPDSPVSAFAGVITEIDGAASGATSLSIDVTAGSIAAGPLRLGNLRPDRHPAIANVQVGDHIRVVGLHLVDDEQRIARARGWTRVSVTPEEPERPTAHQA